MVCGEGLIDLVPAEGAAPELLAPRLGGGPFNTAIALGRLGVPTAFLSRLSSDGFGRRLRAALADAGVDVQWVAMGDEPTTLAVVELSETGEAGYRFYLNGTADRLLAVTDLPDPLPPEVEAYHFGTLSLLTDPGARTLEHVMRTARAAGKVIVLDPNIRPVVLPDPTEYRERIAVWLAHAHLVKVSAADLGWLYPAERPAAVVGRWLAQGVSLVVVTDGRAGTTASSEAGEVVVKPPAVEVVDTIGAGDAFNAGLLAWLHGRGRLSVSGLGRLGRQEMAAALAHANRVAALTCTRAGADSPWADELDAVLPG